MQDPHDLSRFTAAQDGSLARAEAELAASAKVSHWMWWIFPQLAALGRSGTAKRYGIADLAEARAYLRHPELGPRLVRCAGLAAAARGTAREVMGSPDDLKLRSSMTLFAQAAEAEGLDPAPFDAVLHRFYGGAPCPLTLDALAQPS
ncbi:DUF1810 domain-containing protein [Rhodovulum sp. DZ06]|uniref:DUF1810 domain-containing protein n=1 Tax=Rhodovulum sp. DZ06 TaxID=3425126 RepID=UPI003D33E9FA